MRIQSAKAKGRRLAVRVKEILFNYAKDLRPGDIEVTTSSVTGEDLKLSPAARSIYPLVFECKNQEKLNIWDALKQSRQHLKEYEEKNKDQIAYSCVVFSKNHEDTYISMKFEDFLKLIR